MGPPEPLRSVKEQEIGVGPSVQVGVPSQLKRGEATDNKPNPQLLAPASCLVVLQYHTWCCNHYIYYHVTINYFIPYGIIPYTVPLSSCLKWNHFHSRLGERIFVLQSLLSLLSKLKGMSE